MDPFSTAVAAVSLVAIITAAMYCAIALVSFDKPGLSTVGLHQTLRYWLVAAFTGFSLFSAVVLVGFEGTRDMTYALVELHQAHRPVAYALAIVLAAAALIPLYAIFAMYSIYMHPSVQVRGTRRDGTSYQHWEILQRPQVGIGRRC